MQLIRAKLLPPRTSPNLVARPRLVKQLNAGLASRLALVSAPVGFGKTTLLSEWTQQVTVPVAWVTLDQNDDDLHSFLTYFVAAIEGIYPHSCEQMQSLLTAPTLPAPTALVAILANELALLPGELILVLDDYHTLRQMAIHNLMDALIAYLPPMFHLVLGTRSSPPLSLVTWRARGQLCELRQTNLRFTPQETQTFFAQTGQLALDETMLNVLDQRTEGWAAGLRLLLLSLAGNDDLRSITARFTLGDSDIMSFLTDQVLTNLPPALVHFLLSTAIVERFKPSLYPLLAPESSSREDEEAMLAQCLRDNLFMVALGEGWYRYHPLFRELLLHRQERQIGSHALAEQHRLASAWLEQQGLIDDAIRHALQAGDEALAVAVLGRQRMATMGQERWSLLERWLALFPRRLMEQHPLLCITQAWLYNIQFQRSENMVMLERVEQQLGTGAPGLDPATRQIIEGEMCVLACEILYYQGQFQATAANAQRGLELLPVSHSKGRALGYRFLVLGRNHSGDWAGAQATLRRGLEEVTSHSEKFGPGLILIKFFMGLLALDTVAMNETGTLMATWVQERALPESAFWADYYLGWAAYARNELETAKQHFERVVADRYVVHLGVAASSHIILALIRQAQGEEEEALHLMDAAAAFMRETPFLGALAAHETVLALLALLQGRTSDALAWAQRQEETPLLVPNIATTREAPLVLLKILVSTASDANLSRAATLLPGWLATARTANARLITAELLALQARLCQQLGDPDAALAHLAEAITLVSHARPLRLFLDLGRENSRALIPLLTQLNQRNLAPEYLARVLELLSPRALSPASGASPKASGPGPSHALVEALTQREIEILRLIAQGMSNKQIAQALFISDKTVENHTTNIYQKLDVNSRTQAARRANELGLLPSQ
jgi:LuxR family transcriptional regulator, maltose regulon positive regulatory protein